MSLTEIVSNMNLTVYPIIAMVCFLAAFGVIAWRVFKCPRAVTMHNAMLPLDDGDTALTKDEGVKGESRG
ncbi:MAG: hypothetical protein JKY96_08675 [Phycisphaerales bacterium]|nr:hypothetical protein [Phycisphaerales bacterium]